MSVYGVIFCADQAETFIAPGQVSSLQPWVNLRARPDGPRFLIAAVCVPFVGFSRDETPDGTRALLQDRLERGHIDQMITSDAPMKETEARTAALRWLVKAGATDIWQADSDEMITAQQIARIENFWASRPHLYWARLCYKNRVFTPDQYLVEPFTPPRIHRVRMQGAFEAVGFSDDNDVLYQRVDGIFINQRELPNVTVPKSVAWIDHWTWLNDERSRRKQAYQWARWGRCDFAWDESRGGLIWRDGVNPPEVARDS